MNEIKFTVDESRQTVYRELMMYKWLNHTNIPKISTINYCKNRKQIKYSFNLPDGYTTYTTLNKYNNNNNNNNQIIFDQLINVVAYLNSRGVYHQNLLPENIYILSGNKNPLVWLTNFSMANHNHANSRSCNDPSIIEKWHTSQPFNTDELCDGDLWSVGMLGIYLFYDRDVYEWIDNHADDETIDLCYTIRGKFGYGLERAGYYCGDNNINQIINQLLL